MTRALEPYPAYRDSGSPWLGETPEHWEVRRLKACVTDVIDMARGREPGDVYVALEHVESWTGKIVDMDLDTTFESHVKRFRPNDVLFGKLRPYLAKTTRLDRKGVCVGEFLVLRPSNDSLLPAYLEILLRSKSVVDAIDASTFGAKMPRADWQFIGNMRFPLPPLPEQAAIVRYLDHACERIDGYVDAKERLIALLEEWRQAIIGRATTRGLDPNAPMKPTGMDWMPEAPAHWNVTALRHRYSQCLGKMLDSKRITGNHLLPYLRNTDVQWDHINVEDLPEMDILPNEYDRYTVREGDLLICEGGEVGRCAIWSGELAKCGFQKALHRIRPRNVDEDVPRFMYYVLCTAVNRSAFDDGHVSTIQHLTGDKLGTHRFPFPPRAEQTAIVEYLDQAATAIDTAIGRARRQIGLLRECRERLIDDVVTGKLDVREAHIVDGGRSEETGDERRRRLLNEVFADFDARGVGLRMADNLPREALYDRDASS